LYIFNEEMLPLYARPLETSIAFPPIFKNEILLIVHPFAVPGHVIPEPPVFIIVKPENETFVFDPKVTVPVNVTRDDCDMMVIPERFEKLPPVYEPGATASTSPGFKPLMEVCETFPLPLPIITVFALTYMNEKNNTVININRGNRLEVEENNLLRA